MSETSPLAVGGNRLAWTDLPDTMRTTIEAAVGAPVVEASSKAGGFSPALASVLTLADGRSVFAKAVNSSRNEFTVAAIRRESEVLAQLPVEVPAPRLLWSFDDGDWVALVTEAIDGYNPAQPWQPDELSRFLAAASVLSERLSPSPIEAEKLGDDAGDFQSWAKLADEPQFQAMAPKLADLEQHWAAATEGTSLIHGDLRSDNFLLTDSGFVVVDWPAVCIGAPWLDLLLSLPSVALHGGGDPDELWTSHPLSRGVDPDAVNTVLSGLSGFFMFRSLQPVPPLLPTIRQFQRAQGVITLDWLTNRVGWE